jgi:peptidoglycan/xylan/chitin deacetylase (PgdA/CDA1 family)
VFVKTPIFIQKIFPDIVWKKRSFKKEVWLTFDDGPDETITVFLLDLLKSLKIKATFFLVGQQIQKFPEIVKRITEEGHVIGNHTFTHRNGWFTSNKKYYLDINKAQELMHTQIFRPPYGKLGLLQLRKIKKNFKIIMWDVFSWDFKKDIKFEKIYSNVIDNVENGSVIVFHNNIKSFKNLKGILEKILVKLIKEGYSFSTTW